MGFRGGISPCAGEGCITILIDGFSKFKSGFASLRLHATFFFQEQKKNAKMLLTLRCATRVRFVFIESETIAPTGVWLLGFQNPSITVGV